MSIRTLAGTSALVLFMGSSTLLADVTPEEVWQGWQDAIAAGNTKVSAESATRDGDVLEVTNITIGDEANGSLSFESLSFTDQGDGTVAITAPA